jgi:hypothetical protein
MRLVTFGTFAPLTLATLAATLASDAQPLMHVPYIGLLWFGSLAAVPRPPRRPSARPGSRDRPACPLNPIVVQWRDF